MAIRGSYATGSGSGAGAGAGTGAAASSSARQRSTYSSGTRYAEDDYMDDEEDVSCVRLPPHAVARPWASSMQVQVIMH